MLPEPGRLGRRQIAKLVGVSPLADDSGNRQGKRMTWGGRAEVRSVVYMAAIVAMRHIQVIRTFYERMLGSRQNRRRSPSWRAVRKLLTILNAMLRDGVAWDAARHVRDGKAA